jgi:plastocyanin
MRHRSVLMLAVALLAAPALTSAAIVPIAVGPGNTFSPKTPTINVGDTVRWTLMGGSHNVNSDTGLFRSGNVSTSWGPFDHTFNSAGTFGYHCEAHGSAGFAMFGTITVAGGGGGTPGSLQFSVASTSVNESAGTKTITVTRSGGDDGAVSVNYETVDGSATFPGDYIQTNDTLNWADNDDNNKTFVVPIVNDSTQEPSQSFTIRLSSPGGGAILGGNDVITVTINDDDEPTTGDPGTIRFTSATATVGEGAADVTLTAERVSGSTGAVSAEYTTADGSATAGSDYQTTNGTVSWGDGDNSNKTIVVPIAADSVEETNETFTATLSAPTGGATIGNIPTATVTITDDDVTCTPCVEDANTLCLAGGSGEPNRFRVSVTWTDFAGASGPGKAVPFTPDAGFFYFFNNPNNLELLVKMVNGCGTAFDAYWFFYAAASNVGLEYEVLDTTRCVAKTYSNPVGNFASFGDINALATCP